MFTATEAVPVAKVVAGNKRYPGVVALDNVNFTLNKGEVRALLGKNGAGKSTLIRMLTGSERPDSGDIWIGETRLEGDEATLPDGHLSLSDNFRDYNMVVYDTDHYTYRTVLALLERTPGNTLRIATYSVRSGVLITDKRVYRRM